MMPILIFFVTHWYLSLFSQTFLLHRYAAHGNFAMNRFWERFFYVFAYITLGSSYISPRAYAITHRMHHAYTDTELDPHSPLFSKNVFAMMWRTRNIVLGILRGTSEIEPRFTKNLPDWKWLDEVANHPASRIMWVAIYTAFYVAFAPSAWFYLLIPIHAGMGAIQGAIINWNAHKRGYVNFKVKNHSENLMHIDLFFLGEAYHNNHHKFPASLNLAMKRFEFDITYHIIRFLHWMHILRMNTAPNHAHAPKVAIPDLQG